MEKSCAMSAQTAEQSLIHSNALLVCCQAVKEGKDVVQRITRGSCDRRWNGRSFRFGREIIHRMEERIDRLTATDDDIQIPTHFPCISTSRKKSDRDIRVGKKGE